MENIYSNRINYLNKIIKKEQNIRNIFLIIKILSFLGIITFLYRYVGFGTNKLDAFYLLLAY